MVSELETRSMGTGSFVLDRGWCHPCSWVAAVVVPRRPELVVAQTLTEFDRHLIGRSPAEKQKNLRRSRGFRWSG
jgi:hypothetical protein